MEEAVKKFFPQAVSARLDIDAIKSRKDMDIILDNFAAGKTDILVGTQLVAKGLDFDNVGVVGIIAADTGLNIPDYRSAERTFQLVTQAAGRAGRRDVQGTVVIQTYEPDNYALTDAAAHNYDVFFDQEIRLRKFMDYPPFTDLIMVNFTSEEEEKTFECADMASDYLHRTIGDRAEGKILEPKNP